VQLTDLHFGPATTARHIERAIAVSNDLNPDIVALTGDYVQFSATGIGHAIAHRFNPKMFRWIDYRREVRELAGRLGTDAHGAIPADTEKEIRNLLDGIKATLAEAKMTMDDLVTVQVFCPDLTRYDTFNAIYRTYFKKNFPARAFIGSGALLRGAHFEMQAIAVRQ